MQSDLGLDSVSEVEEGVGCRGERQEKTNTNPLPPFNHRKLHELWI